MINDKVAPGPPFDFEAHLELERIWSAKTFGPGHRSSTAWSDVACRYRKRYNRCEGRARGELC